MTAGQVPASFQPSRLRAVGASPVGLAVGDTLKAQVTRDLGDGQYTLRIGNQTITASSDQPLTPGEPLQLRVIETDGKLVFERVGTAPTRAQPPLNLPPSATSAAATAPRDEASVAAPFGVRVSLTKVAEHIPPLPPGGTVTAGVVADGAEVVLHFPSGAIVEGEAVPLNSSSTSSSAAPAQNLTTAALPQLAAGAAATITLQIMTVQAFLGQENGQTTSVAVSVPIAATPALLDALALMQTSGGIVTPPAAPAGDARTLSGSFPVQIGGATATVHLPDGVSILPNATNSLLLTDQALLTGNLTLASDTAAPAENRIDAALRSANLTANPNTREAASALIAHSLPVTRENVQALLSLTAGLESSARTTLMATGAALIARDIPLAAPLAAGLAGIVQGDAGLAPLLADTFTALQAASRAGGAMNENLAAQQSVLLAQDSLAALTVPLGESTSTAKLQQFFTSLGREQLGQALAQVENAAQIIIQNRPALQALDGALNALLSTSAPPSDPLATTPLATRLAHPGVHAPATGLPPAAPGSVPNQETLAQIVREILSAPNADTAATLARSVMENRDHPFQRALLTQLEVAEVAELAREPALSRLADAAKSLGDLGRRFLAYKAENLAGLRQDPATFVAEIPFRLAEEHGEGKLQVYYRQAQSSQADRKRWSARIVLDLATTQLGAVVGDLRFVEKEIQLNLLTESDDMAAWLGRDQAELSAALHQLGFRPNLRFAAMSQETAPPRAEIFSDHPLPPEDSPRLDTRV